MINSNFNTKEFPSLRGGTAGDGVDCTPKWIKNSLFPYYLLPKNKELEPLSKKLKKAGVLSEVIFWNAFKSKKLLGWDIDRQVIIGNYIVDFLIPALGLVVEIDGCSHDSKGEYDLERNKYLEDLGLEVLHYTDLEVKKSLDFVSESFQMAIKKRVVELMSTPSLRATPQEGNHS
jgi:very-short-patch-repair endonuclease